MSQNGKTLKTLANVERRAGLKIKASVREFQEAYGLDIREWYLDSQGEYQAGRKGIWISDVVIYDFLSQLGVKKKNIEEIQEMINAHRNGAPEEVEEEAVAAKGKAAK
jgi:hypothetical protein